jgi:hypothetical protein
MKLSRTVIAAAATLFLLGGALAAGGGPAGGGAAGGGPAGGGPATGAGSGPGLGGNKTAEPLNKSASPTNKMAAPHAGSHKTNGYRVNNHRSLNQ